MKSDTSGSECLEKCRGSYVGQKQFEKAERESPENVCYTSMPVWSEDRGVDRTKTAEAASLLCKQTSKESRGVKTSRTQERGKATAEMGGLREEGYEKIGGG